MFPHMTTNQYQSLLTHAALALTAVHGGDKTQAKAQLESTIGGLRGTVVGTTALAMDVMDRTTNKTMARSMALGIKLADCAWACFLEDLKGAIGT